MTTTCPSSVAEAVEHLRVTTGISVPEYRWPVLDTVLRRVLGEVRPAALTAWLRQHPDAWRELLHAVVVPETYFFRHFGHFRVLLALARKRLVEGRPCRVLSAGCSTGEEAWSAAAILASVYLPGHDNFAVEAWELDPILTRRARSGEYRDWSARNGFYDYEAYFTRSGQHWRIRSDLRPFVRFRVVNMVADDLPDEDGFDAIFFRNVAIYWESRTIRQVLEKLTARLLPDGLLLLGPGDPVELNRKEWESKATEGTLAYRRRRKEAAPGQTTGLRSTNERSTNERSTEKNQHRGSTEITSGTLSAGFRPLTSATDSFELRRESLERTLTDSQPEKPIKAAPPVAAPEKKPRVALGGPGTWLDKAQRLADEGRYEDALTLIDGRGTATVNPAGRVLAGILLLNLERPEEAMRRFRAAVFLEPEVPAHRRWLAVSLEALGREADAAREIKNAEELETE